MKKLTRITNNNIFENIEILNTNNIRIYYSLYIKAYFIYYFYDGKNFKFSYAKNLKRCFSNMKSNLSGECESYDNDDILKVFQHDTNT